MGTRIAKLFALSLAGTLVILPFVPAIAGEAEKASTPAAEEKKRVETKPAEAPTEKVAGLVGTVVAVDSGTGTLVVDVPLGKDILRVGAWTTPTSKISGVKFLGDVKVGSRVRITFRRVETGDELVSLDVLGGPK